MSQTSSKLMFIDDFGKGPYSLRDGQTSPDGKWFCDFTGYGAVGVKAISEPKNGRDGSCMALRPRVVTDPNQTSASQVSTVKSFEGDFIWTGFLRTLSQNRAVNPATWECAWVGWRFTDPTHHYYAILKTNNTIEVGKKDYEKVGTNQVRTPDGKVYTVTTQDQQQFLSTGIKFDDSVEGFKLGRWYKFTVSMTGFNIKIYVNDKLKVNIVDDGKTGTDGITGFKPITWQPSSKMRSGKYWLYTEDASVEFDNMKIVRP